MLVRVALAPREKGVESAPRFSGAIAHCRVPCEGEQRNEARGVRGALEQPVRDDRPDEGRHGPLYAKLGERKDLDQPLAVRRPDGNILRPPRARICEEGALGVCLARALGAELRDEVALGRQARRLRLGHGREQLEPDVEHADRQLRLLAHTGEFNRDSARGGRADGEHLAPLEEMRADDLAQHAVLARAHQHQVKQLLVREQAVERRASLARRARRVEPEEERVVELRLDSGGRGARTSSLRAQLREDGERLKRGRQPRGCAARRDVLHKRLASEQADVQVALATEQHGQAVGRAAGRRGRPALGSQRLKLS